jgi:hypothetical protein
MVPHNSAFAPAPDLIGCGFFSQARPLAPKPADLAMLAKASMAAELGIKVNLCGTKKNGGDWS